MMPAAIEAFLRSLEDKSKQEIVDIAVNLFHAKTDLEIQVKEFQNADSAMMREYQQMKDELQNTRKEIDALRKQILHLASIQTIQTNDLFGRSTEKTNDVLQQAIEGTLPEKNPLAEDAAEQTERKKNNRYHDQKVIPLFDDLDKKTAGRMKRMDLSELPVQSFFDYDIDELNRKYGENNWRFCFWKAKKSVELIRQSTYLKVTYTPIVSVGLEHEMFRVFEGNAMIPKSVASPSLLAQIILDCNRMYLPLYRQEFDSNRFGFALSRQTMSNWVLYVSQTYFRPLYEYLCNLLRDREYQNCDETYYSVVLDGRNPGAKSFIWVHCSGALDNNPNIVTYYYEKTRGTDHLRNFYAGLQKQIYLTCDAYSAYSCFASESNSLVTLTGCFMHCRRRFIEAVRTLKLKDMTLEQILKHPEARAIQLIRDIYLAENSLKCLSPAERLERRKQEVLPKVDAFFEFVSGIDINDPLLCEKMKDAIQYARNQEILLRRFLTDGSIPIDNGLAERCVKPIALYRRNSLFSYSIRGAESTLISFSLIETARANNADPYFYLKYLLEQTPDHLYDKNREYIPELMPWSDKYQQYESDARLNQYKAQAPPSNVKPRTPTIEKHIIHSA